MYESVNNTHVSNGSIKTHLGDVFYFLELSSAFITHSGLLYNQCQISAVVKKKQVMKQTPVSPQKNEFIKLHSVTSTDSS